MGVADDIRTKLYDLMVALKVVMATGYDPTFSYVYNHHRVAKLQLNAVTVDIDQSDVDRNTAGAIGAIVVPIEVTASIRVHLAYSDGYMDSVKSTKLLQSIDNYLHENINLGDGYWIVATGPTRHREYFEESATGGGEMTVTIEINQEYTLS